MELAGGIVFLFGVIVLLTWPNWLLFVTLSVFVFLVPSLKEK